MGSLVSLHSCQKDDSVLPNQAAQTLKQGNWRISYFWDDNDETQHFEGYTFTFGNDGTVSAVRTSSSVSGTWGTRKDDGFTKLDLNFGSTPVFDDLNDDWKIKTHTDAKIELEDVSGGNGETDYLTFEKN